MSSEQEFDILMIGFSSLLKELATPILKEFKIKEIANMADFEKILEDGAQRPMAALVSSDLEGIGHMEIAQTLSSYFSGMHLAFITGDRTKFEFEKLKKNGFTASFLLPFDHNTFNEFVETLLQQSKGKAARQYKAVKLMDIQAGQSLPFEVTTYLAANKKYVRLTSSGALSEKKVELLKQKSVNSVFIDHAQVGKFYEFAAEQLISKGVASNDAVSATQKAEQFQSTVRGLFRSIFDTSDTSGDFQVGRDLLDQSKKIVESYVVQKTGVNLAEKLKGLISETNDSYSRAQTISTMACLFSMGIQVGSPEDLAIAGLFNDIGVEGMNPDANLFDYEKLSKEEKDKFIQHPRLSVKILKEKRITLTPLISDIIEKHHERIDGSGFPAALAAHKIPIEAQLLAYTDAFEHLSRVEVGHAAKPPKEVHEEICKRLKIDADLLRKLGQFLASAEADSKRAS